jgi:hypothetical protein
MLACAHTGPHNNLQIIGSIIITGAMGLSTRVYFIPSMPKIQRYPTTWESAFPEKLKSRYYDLFNGAEAAVTGAYLNHGHECSCALREATAYILAMDSLADRMEV